jgi:hypothetical protein
MSTQLKISQVAYLEQLKERVRARYPHLYPVRSISPVDMARLASVTIRERFNYVHYGRVLEAKNSPAYLNAAR